MIKQIVQHIIHVVDMVIVAILNMAIGLVSVSFGGMEHYVINRQIPQIKLLEQVGSIKTELERSQ